RLDGNRRFHPSESGSAMQSYFWDGTLGSLDPGVTICITPRDKKSEICEIQATASRCAQRDLVASWIAHVNAAAHRNGERMGTSTRNCRAMVR
ncbi:hypothetical protein, partial [Burkholderia ubonensis]|uniref:hypothetical protein n=1 Tax=Burkholderia ubonensis TaxID=101571 RepID=UPI001E4FABC6